MDLKLQNFQKYLYTYLPFITFTKRQHLIIEALLYTKNPIKLILNLQIIPNFITSTFEELIKKLKIIIKITYLKCF
ncbi:MAG: hypothetical protein ACK4GJ_01465 [bacterium]